LKIATVWLVRSSSFVNSRPVTRGIPRVRKYPGPTRLKRELATSSAGGTNPSMASDVESLLPPIAGTVAAETSATPGTVASRSAS
jgi:hypothetical protein